MTKENGRRSLLKNTTMLYILTFSNYFLGLVTVPYLTRVLGPSVYGNVGVGQAFSTYIQLFLDFGFILSATAEIAQNRDDKRKVSNIFISVMCCKILLILVSLVVVITLIAFVPFLHSDAYLFFFFWAYVAVNSLLPDFLYRGLERMEVITVRTVILKMIFTLCVFVFIKDKTQYLLVPIFYLCGALFSVLFVLVDILKTVKIKFTRVTFADIFRELKNSGMYFVSRIAGTVYSALNTIVLGAVLPGSVTLGYYSASEKLLTAGRGAITPVTDSLYPHMVNKKDYKLAKKIIIYGTSMLLIGCIFVGVFAEEVCVLLFGAEYVDAANVLRLMLPLIVTALPNYVIAFPVLTPLGMVKYANLAVVVGAIVQALGMVVLYFCSNINVYSICILTLFTEVIVVSIRAGAALVGVKRKRMEIK